MNENLIMNFESKKNSDDYQVKKNEIMESMETLVYDKLEKERNAEGLIRDIM